MVPTHLRRHSAAVPSPCSGGAAVTANKTVHRHLVRDRGRAATHVCVDCGGPACDWSYDHQDPTELCDHRGPYSTDLDHYQARCRTCHRALDMVGANFAAGERNGAARLTEWDVRQIHAMREFGLPVHAIAARFNLSKGATWMILHGYRWGHITIDQQPPPKEEL